MTDFRVCGERDNQYTTETKLWIANTENCEWPICKNVFPPSLEPGTFRVLGERDNHYTTETQWVEY